MAKTIKTKKSAIPAKKQTSDTKETESLAESKLTAKQFIERLKSYQSDAESKKIQRYFKSGEGQYGEGDQFMGVKMGELFTLGKEFAGMPVKELEKLSPKEKEHYMKLKDMR